MEQRCKPPPVVDNQGRLLLCEEEWSAKLKLRNTEGNSNGSSSSGSRRKCTGKLGQRGHSDSGRKDRPASGADKCLKCGTMGHWAKDCRSKPKRAEAHLAQTEDEAEPTLLIVKASVISPATPHSIVPHGAATETSQSRPIRIVEAKVFAQLDGDEGRDERRWVLDSGATNHMSRSRGVFLEIDTGVTGSVKLAMLPRFPLRGSALSCSKASLASISFSWGCISSRGSPPTS